MREYILDNFFSLLCFYMSAQSKTGHSPFTPYGDVIGEVGWARRGVEGVRDGSSEVLRVGTAILEISSPVEVFNFIC